MTATSAATHERYDTHQRAGGSTFDPGQNGLDDQNPVAGVDPSAAAHSNADIHTRSGGGTFDLGQGGNDTRRSGAGVEGAAVHVPAGPHGGTGGGTLGQTDVDAQTTDAELGGAAVQAMDDTHGRPGGGTLDPGQSSIDAQSSSAGVDPSAAAPELRDTHVCNGDGTLESPPIPWTDTHDDVDGWLELRIWSEQLEDAMAARIAAVNRAERGGVDPEVYAVYIDSLTAAEKVCDREMRRCYRRVVPPEIVAWQLSERGIGDKLTARLLGHLGDPCIATPHHWEGNGTARRLVGDEPYVRTIGQLWQYCGVGDPHRRKTRGMTAEEASALGNPILKMLMHLHAESCVKTGSGHYRDVYDEARLAYESRTHATECVRCGPSGKPAQVGTPWSKGHQHGAALRKIAKEILRDLWRVRHAALFPSSIPTPPSMTCTATGSSNTHATPNPPPTAA